MKILFSKWIYFESVTGQTICRVCLILPTTSFSQANPYFAADNKTSDEFILFLNYQYLNDKNINSAIHMLPFGLPSS